MSVIVAVVTKGDSGLSFLQELLKKNKRSKNIPVEFLYLSNGIIYCLSF